MTFRLISDIVRDMTATLSIRPRRQVTLPEKFLQAVGANVGDQLEADIKDNQIVLKTKKKIFLDALGEIQKAVKESGISEKEMQDSLKQIRRDIYEKKYSKGLSGQ